MNTRRWISAAILILLSVVSYQGVSGLEIPAFAADPIKPSSGVLLSAGHGSSIEFKTQNGRTINGADPQSSEIPHLVLLRNGELTNPKERTLLVNVDGIQVPYPGVTVVLTVETQHEESYLDGAEKGRIRVWMESQSIPNSEEGTTKSLSLEFTLEFDETVSTESGSINTPTDYFRYEISIIHDGDISRAPLYTFSREYAFLMENQWVTSLPEVPEMEEGAAPDELVVYYADMFDYELNPFVHGSRLHRDQVTLFVSQELVPGMVNAYRTQSEAWGFTWYPEWTSYRSGEDAERLSVALSEPGVWYHGWAPGSAHSGITISTSAPGYERYESLLDAMLGAFHHELFHNHQRGINQHLYGNGDVSGEGDVLAFFTEGMALMASSVGGEQVEFEATRKPRDYFTKANIFIAGDEFYGNSLNTSYAELDPYTAAVYWRFLYDQCGGMAVIRKTLQILYSQEVAIRSDRDLVEKLPHIMDRVLASPDADTCPFSSYEESLAEFARAIYALRLDGGRCGKAGSLAGCGFYDPEQAYKVPEAASIVFSGEAQHYSDEISSSYGMDFVEIHLDRTANAQPLRAVIKLASGSSTQMNIHALQLIEGRDERIQTRFRGIDPNVVDKGADGNYCISIPEVDTDEYSRLALIITRVDGNENIVSSGRYSIDLTPERDC